MTLTLCGGLVPIHGGPVLMRASWVDVGRRSRVVSAWSSVWRALPLDVSTAILGHWSRPDLRDEHGRARVVLRDTVPGGELAHVDCDGIVIRVTVAALDLSDGWVRFIVAHEIAHCYQHAQDRIGWTRAERDDNEIEASALACAWGFARPSDDARERPSTAR